jgi:hypothetical protein
MINLPAFLRPIGTEPNGTEFSPKTEGPTCLFGFFDIFEVVPGAGLGEGKGNRRGTQMNSEVKSSLRSLRSLRLRKNRGSATGSEPQVAEPSSIFTARNARISKIPGVHANARRQELANPLAQKNAPSPRSQSKTSKRSLNSETFLPVPSSSHAIVGVAPFAPRPALIF